MKKVTASLCCLLLLWLAGCTVSGNQSASPALTPSITLTLTPNSTSVTTGGTVQFAATVTGSSNTGVIWSATGGTISSTGLYTAGSVVGTYTVRATSVANDTKSAAASVTVTAPGTVTVSISPASASLAPGGTTQFTASVTGSSNTAVTWSASGGSVSSSGLYTAGSVVGNYTVRATSVADNTKSATANVSVAAAVQHQVVLSWIANASAAGYRVYRGTQSGGPYTLLTSTLVAGTTYTDNTVAAGQTYYYVATSVDSAEVESVFSSEVAAHIPSP